MFLRLKVYFRNGLEFPMAQLYSAIEMAYDLPFNLHNKYVLLEVVWKFQVSLNLNF